jgi:site-specific recombinase XerD
MRCSYRKVREYTEERHPDKEIWQLTLQEYIRWVGEERNRGKRAGSLNKQLCHIRGLLEYAWRSGRLDRNVLEGFILKDAHQRKPPRVLTEQEAEDLIQESGGGTPAKRRSRLLVLLCYGCGLRTSEVAHLNVQDIDREKQEIVITQGKGGKERQLPVPEGVWTELMAYLADRGGKRGPLFKTAIKKKRISTREINETIKGLGEQAGIEQKVTPMVLRHSFATHLMDAGVDIGIISKLMGHRGPRETGIYLHALERNKRESISHIYEEDITTKEEHNEMGSE